MQKSVILELGGVKISKFLEGCERFDSGHEDLCKLPLNKKNAISFLWIMNDTFN